MDDPFRRGDVAMVVQGEIRLQRVGVEEVRNQGERAVHAALGRVVLPEQRVRVGEVEPDPVGAGVQLGRPVVTGDGLPHEALAPADVADLLVDLGVARLQAPREAQLVDGGLVVQGAPIVVQAQGHVGLCQFRVEGDGAVDGRLGGREPQW